MRTTPCKSTQGNQPNIRRQPQVSSRPQLVVPRRASDRLGAVPDRVATSSRPGLPPRTARGRARAFGTSTHGLAGSPTAGRVKAGRVVLYSLSGRVHENDLVFALSNCEQTPCKKDNGSSLVMKNSMKTCVFGMTSFQYFIFFGLFT